MSQQDGAEDKRSETSASAAKLRADDLPALFWDEMPENEEHPDLLALKALDEETTPEEKAENFKSLGNDALKTGLKLRKKFYLREAITKYTSGIAAQCGDAALNSILHSNRAQVQLLLGNHKHALDDSVHAIKLNPNNLKAYYRGGKAALKLGDFCKAGEIAQQGLEVQPDARELAELQQAVQEKVAEKAAAEQREQQERDSARAPARALSTALLDRGWQIGRPQFSIGDRKPFLDENGWVHWPVLFIYPETMQTDAVEDFCEANMLGEHLDVMFGPEAPPLVWDTGHNYTRENLELFYLSHAARPMSGEALTEVLYGGWPKDLPKDEGPARYGTKAAKWIEVLDSHTLAEVLARKDYVVPGIPVFFVVAKGTTFRDTFLAGEFPLL